MLRSRLTVALVALLLLGSLAATTACHGPATERASSGKAASSSSVAPSVPATTVFGPYMRGRKVTVGRMEFELIGFRICNAEVMRYSERMSNHPGLRATVAAAGNRYVDTAVRVRTLDSTASPSVLVTPHLGKAYVLASGRRFDSVDGGATGMSDQPSIVSMISEFEMPASTPHAVLFWPTSEAATSVVSFTLW
jgi:hypothetical protein